MKWFGHQNIPNKLIAICLATILFILVVASCGFLFHEYISYRSEVKNKYTELAKFIGRACSQALKNEDVILANKFLSGLEVNSNILAVCIYDRYGHGFAGHLRKDAYNFEFPRVQLEGVWLKDNQIEVFRRITAEGEFIGTVYLKAEFVPFIKRLWEYAGIILVAVAISTLVSIISAIWIYSSISKPIKRLSSAVKKVADEDDFTVRLHKDSNDEIGALFESFNWMLEQIKQREDKLKNVQKDLEKRVSERTEELVKINEQLKIEITERKKAEESLKNSQQKLILHIQQTPLGVIDWTLDQRAINWNPAAEKIFGYKESEVIGKTVFDLIVPDSHRNEYMALWDALLNRSGGNHAIIKSKTKSGKIITCEWFNTLLTSRDGRAIGVASLVMDITHEIESQLELRKYEEQTRKTEKMHALGQLAAGIAHDFNNMLTIIQGHVGMLLSKSDADTPAREALKRIYDASAHAANLVKQLLTLGRKAEFKPSLVDLNEVVVKFYQLISRALGENIKTTIEAHKEQLPSRCDSTLIEQLILNMCLNARDAMPDGGKLLIKTEKVTIQDSQSAKNPEAKPGNYACLIVSDTGIGMDESMRQRIFEPFFSSKEPGKGTGLGLAMVYGIVKQHNGWIEVESQPGKGTTFKIYFPLESDNVALKQPESAIKAPFEELRGQETVLVVEDEPSLRDMVCGILKHYGYKIVGAFSGTEALKICEDSNLHFDLLLSDMVLPDGISGRELARRLKSRYSNLKVIITSGYSVDPQINKFEYQDGVVFLPKPYHPVTLLRTVRYILDEKNAKKTVESTENIENIQCVQN
ncbi:MAG: ATP-binding protein [Verrucomicrobiae bacterium]|nr:ATP-binding protein [Verrucomicrobiae bacterium]